MKKIKELLFKAGWAPISVVVLHALTYVIFGFKPYTDPTAHFLGGVAMAYFMHHALIMLAPSFGQPARWAHFVQVFCMTMTVAVLWEFAEYAAGGLIGFYTQLNLEETMSDLFLGCAGAMTAILALSALSSSK